MARLRKTTDKPATGKRRIEQYDHKGQQRKNNLERIEAYRVAALRGGRAQARSRQDRGRPRHRESQDHPGAMTPSRLRIDLPRDKLADFCRRHHIRRLAFFSSVLRDDFTPDSDVDVLVEFQTGGSSRSCARRGGRSGSR